MNNHAVDNLEIADRGKNAATEYETPQLLMGLSSSPRSIPSSFFYDDNGCALFEQLCLQPEYYLARLEREILARHAGELAAIAGPCQLVDLGSGNPHKTALLLRAFADAGRLPEFVPIDINKDSIVRGASQLHLLFPKLKISGVAGTYADGVVALPKWPGRRVFLFLGSTIGNMSAEEATDLLTMVRHHAKTLDMLVVGTDLVKDRQIIEAAYNDAAGIASRMRANLFPHLNGRYDGNFNPGKFSILAVYNEDRRQMEVRVRSNENQTVRLSKLGLCVPLEKGEELQAMIMRKFDLEEFSKIVEATGYCHLKSWLDENKWYAVSLFQIA